MLQLEVLVLEFLPIDRLPACPIASGEVSPLNHKVLDDPVKDGPFLWSFGIPRPGATVLTLVAKRLARFSRAFLSCAQRTEVFCCFGHNWSLAEYGTHNT